MINVTIISKERGANSYDEGEQKVTKINAYVGIKRSSHRNHDSMWQQRNNSEYFRCKEKGQ